MWESEEEEREGEGKAVKGIEVGRSLALQMPIETGWDSAGWAILNVSFPPTMDVEYGNVRYTLLEASVHTT